MEKGVRFIGNGQAPGTSSLFSLSQLFDKTSDISPPILGGNYGVLEGWYIRYQVPSHSSSQTGRFP